LVCLCASDRAHFPDVANLAGLRTWRCRNLPGPRSTLRSSGRRLWPRYKWQLHGRLPQLADRLHRQSDAPKRLLLKWRNEFRPELKAEGYSRCVIELESIDETVKLTITHEMDSPDSKFLEAVSAGWPRILSNLKSLLESGDVALKLQRVRL